MDPDMTSPFDRYVAASARLDALIDRTPHPTDSSRDAVRERATFRMGRLRRFLDFLGNPHHTYPIVHIGGTSGKGSTSTTLAAMLREAGYHTGLHTSPYLQSATEKLQLNGDLISVDAFVELTDRVLTAHERWIGADGEPLTYGEVWVALSLQFFHDAHVDIAVLEVGAGGRFDLTNIVDPVLSVITSVSIDHTQTLGPTIADIAWHKAGIIKPGVPVVTAVSDPVALAIIREEAHAQGAALTELNLDRDIVVTAMDMMQTTWRETASDDEFTIQMSGRFQAGNGATAVAAARALEASGVSVPIAAIHAGLATTRIPGRGEVVEDVVPVLLDGAHNPEKIAALARDLDVLMPRTGNGKRIALIGALLAKQAEAMIRPLLQGFDVLVTTSPRVFAKESRAAESLADEARNLGFTGDIHTEADPKAALQLALALADPARGDRLLVTGSLYLIGNVREHWYPINAILTLGSPWPALAHEQTP